MIDSKPLIIGKFVDQRVRNLLLKILKKNSSERLSCRQILGDRDFRDLISEFERSAPEAPKPRHSKSAQR